MRKNSLQRLTKRVVPGIGISFFTPSQADFRRAAKSRYGVFAGDPTRSTQHPASHVLVHNDGTVDVTSLETDGQDWFDLGGQGGIDVAAGR